MVLDRDAQPYKSSTNVTKLRQMSRFGFYLGHIERTKLFTVQFLQKNQIML